MSDYLYLKATDNEELRCFLYCKFEQYVEYIVELPVILKVDAYVKRIGSTI